MSFIYLCTGKVLEKIIYLENFSQLTNRLKRFLYRSAIKIFVLILKKLVEKKINKNNISIYFFGNNALFHLRHGLFSSC